MLKLNVNALIYWGIYFTDLATCQKIMSICLLHFYRNWVPTKQASGKSLFLALVNSVSDLIVLFLSLASDLHYLMISVIFYVCLININNLSLFCSISCSKFIR
jgi:hypothetical protein